MKKHSKYFTDVKKFAKWYMRKQGINLPLEGYVRRNGDKLLQLMEEENTKRIRSFKAANILNAKKVDRIKLGSILKNTYASRPDLRQKMSENGKNTVKKLKANGTYQSESFKEGAKRGGQARQALLNQQEKSDLGRKAVLSRTEEGKSSAGKKRAESTNSIIYKCQHCSDPGCNPRTYARYHGDNCMWKNTSEQDFFNSLNKDILTRKEITQASESFGLNPSRVCSERYFKKIKKGIYRKLNP